MCVCVNSVRLVVLAEVIVEQSTGPISCNVRSCMKCHQAVCSLAVSCEIDVFSCSVM